MAAPGAGADVISPPGACSGTGRWLEAGFEETSAEHVPSDVIEVPLSDEVAWTGSVGGAAVGQEGPRREISGEVQLDLPLGTVTIDDWGGSSTRYANEGVHDYKLPKVLAGVEVVLHGEHREDGQVVCSGSVHVQFEGSATENPLTYGGLAGLVASGAMLYAAGRPAFRRVA
jgi:hypothetical protein